MLLLLPGSWRQSPSILVLSWAILVCTLLLVFLGKRRLTLRRAKALGQRGSAHHQVCGGGADNGTSTVHADDSLRPPALLTSPPTLQALCLSAMSTNLSSFHEDTDHLMKQVPKSQPPKLAGVPRGKPIVRESQEDGEQVARKSRNDLSDNTYCPEPPERLKEDISRWGPRGQEKEGEERLDLSKAPMEPVLRDQARPSWSKAGPGLQAIPSPDHPADLAAAGTWQVQQDRPAGNGHHPAHRAAVALRGATDVASFRVSPPRPEGERQDRATQLGTQRQEITELIRQIHSLQAQEASLHWEISQLDSDIGQLKLNVEKAQDEHDQDILQTHRKDFQGQAQHSQMKKKLASVYRDMNFTCQVRNMYKKMAQDLGKELDINSSHYCSLVLHHQDRAANSWVAAVSAQRRLQELKQQNDHLRQMLTGCWSLY